MWTSFSCQQPRFWLEDSGGQEACLRSLWGAGLPPIFSLLRIIIRGSGLSPLLFVPAHNCSWQSQCCPVSGENGLWNNLTNSRWVKLNWGNRFIHWSAPSGQGELLEFLIVKSLTSWVQVSIWSDDNSLKLIIVMVAQFCEILKTIELYTLNNELW